MKREWSGSWFGAVLALCFCAPISASLSAAEVSPDDGATVEHPLEPPNTTSPRATLRTFLNNAREAWQLYLDHGQARIQLKSHAIRCLNLSEVPEVQQHGVGLEASIKLFDVFNRIPLPDLKDVPDEGEMGSMQTTSWTVPHTPIVIARVAEGPRAGEWLFTPQTVARAAEFYRQTRHLPVKPNAIIEDGYRLYRGQPGWMIPSSWHTALPAGAHKVYYDQTLLQWFLLVIVLVVAGSLAWMIVRWSRREAADPQASAARAFAGPVMLMLLSSSVLYLIDEQVNITGALLVVLRHFFDAVFYLAAAWGTVLAGRLVIKVILNSPRFDLTQLGADFVSLIVRLLSFAVVLMIAAIWLNSVGIPVLGVLAGLGIGGIAIALAAQRTIENFFGAMMLFADRPVRIGDRCRFGDKMGTVERIGLRATRIRTLERSVLSVPNAEFSRLQLENLAQRDRFLFRTTLNLRLETTPEQLRLILYRVRGLLLNSDDVDDEPARVRLVAVGPSSLDLEIFAYIKTSDRNVFFAIREELYLEILRELENAGTALAPPARIEYVESARPVTPNVKESPGD